MVLCILSLLLFIYPLSGFLDGRNYWQLEWFALSPDATVLFTVMFIMLIKEKWMYILLPLPIVWLLITISNALTLKLSQWQIMPFLLLCG